MNLPNKLTVARVCLIPVFLVIYLGQIFGPASHYVALAIFAVASATDWLDGYIARKHHLITNFGKFMDPLADKLLVCSAMVAMVPLRLPAWAVIIIISREFIITGFRLIAAEKNMVLAADIWGKIKTVTQMLLIIFLLLELSGAWVPAVSWILITLSVFFTILSACNYIFKNLNVLKED